MPIQQKDHQYVYIPPLNHFGKQYIVPIVIKDKSSLLAYQSGVWDIYSIVGERLDYRPEIFLSSQRFYDLTHHGYRLQDLDKDELLEHVRSLVENGIERLTNNHIDNHVSSLDEYFLPVSCKCGNFHGYKKPEDIPDEDLNCEICGNKIIEYTNLDDHQIEYQGIDTDFYNSIIQTVQSEYEVDDEEESDEDKNEI